MGLLQWLFGKKETVKKQPLPNFEKTQYRNRLPKYESASAFEDEYERRKRNQLNDNATFIITSDLSNTNDYSATVNNDNSGGFSGGFGGGDYSGGGSSGSWSDSSSSDSNSSYDSSSSDSSSSSFD